MKLRNKNKVSRMSRYLDAVEEEYGPAPTNPFKELRDRSNLTMQEITEQVGVSRQALIRCEQGTYPTAIERLVNFWCDRGDIGWTELVNTYAEFQTLTRQRHRRPFGSIPDFSVDPNQYSNHPLLVMLDYWMLPDGTPNGAMNPTEFSKLFCVNQATVDHWLNKVHNQASVPGLILSALKQSGYSVSELTRLEKAYVKHREVVLGGKSTDVSLVEVRRTGTGRLKVNDAPVGYSSRDYGSRAKRVIREELAND